MDRQTNRQIHRQRQTDKEIGRHRETDMQSNIQFNRFSVAKFPDFQSWNDNFPEIIQTINPSHKCHKWY